MNTYLLPQNANDYMTTFRYLAAITNDAMDFIEQHPPIHLNTLDRIAQNVETIACLRGDSGVYVQSRPQGLSDFQGEMYEAEGQLRARLLSLGYTYPTPRSISETV